MASNIVARGPQSYAPPPSVSSRAAKACQISEKCRSEAHTDKQHPEWPPGPLTCKTNDLACIFGEDSYLLGNRYFSSSCLAGECEADEDKKEFVLQYMKFANYQHYYKNSFPPDWTLFAPADLPDKAPESTSSTITLASTLTSTLLSTSTLAPSTTSPTTAPTTQQSTMESPQAPPLAATTTTWADIHIPMCGVTENCLVDKKSIDPCRLTNLRCVCKISSSISKSTYFEQNCLFNECYSELGRKEWMDSFAYACDKSNITLVDISDQWKPFVPAWYMQKYFPGTTPIGPSPHNSTETQHHDMGKGLSTGAIAGIAVSIGCLFIGLLIAGILFYLRSKKKQRESDKQKAILEDQLQVGGGVHARINALQPMHQRTSSDSLGTTRVDTHVGSWAPKSVDSTPFRPECYHPQQHPNPTAPSSIYDDLDKQSQFPSKVAYWNHGYRPPVRSPPPRHQSVSQPPQRPLRPDEDEILPTPRHSVLHEVQGSPVYNERGVRTQSWMSPVMTASHTSPVYGLDGETVGYRQTGF